MLRDAAERTRPLCEYAEHSLERLAVANRTINDKCNDTQQQVDSFMQKYFEALEVHRTTLLNQIERLRESKLNMLQQQQQDLGIFLNNP